MTSKHKIELYRYGCMMMSRIIQTKPPIAKKRTALVRTKIPGWPDQFKLGVIILKMLANFIFCMNKFPN